VPWGALGIGTKISAAIAGAPLDDVTWRVAIVVAPVLWIVVVLYWRIALTCGVTVDSAQRREDLACITVLSVLLIFTNLILPIELAGLCAIGPVLMFRMWRQEGTHLFTLAALRRGAPYLFLMLLLAITKLVPALTTYLSTPAFTPGQGAPVFAPLASPAISLLIATIIGALAHRHWRGLSDSLVPTITKGARACAMTILLVALAWIIVRSGIAHAFAQAMHASLGHHATLTVPLLGSLGGYLTGSNTGAGSLAMPVAKAMAANTEVLWWIAAAAIMVGSMFTAISPVRFAMGQAIANARKEDVGRALRSLTPLALVTVSIAVLTAFFANLWHG
jgi:lactate permease